MTPIRISASLVLYKPDLQIVERALLALQEAGQVARQQYVLQLDLTLVDNSDDGVLHGAMITWLEGVRARVPDWNLQLLRAPGNLGYGRGNNLVIANTQSDYHIVINPDLFVEVDTLLEALRFMEVNPDVGLLSPAVFGEDGERHYQCKRHPTLLVMFLRSFAPSWVRSRLSFITDKFEMRDCDYAKNIEPLEYPTGCFMFFRTAPLKAINGFDPEFFLHYEDADIGRRMLKIARVVYVPSVRVKHLWARDTHRSLRAMMVTVTSGWLYWRKWGGMFSTRPAGGLRVAVPRTGEDPKLDTVPATGRRVLVTGANGFIGKAVCTNLLTRGYRVVGAVRRRPDPDSPIPVPYLAMGSIDEHTDWSGALSGVDCVVHLAGRAHQMRDTAVDPLAEFRRVNVALTLNLARQAAILGVRRFVFISSVKVNGESTPVGQPFTEADVPQPVDPYGVSKFEAEQALLQLARQTGMEVVIIRPVLVYGPGVGANFHTMMRWTLAGVPLPLGALHNRRSFLALDNLVDLIATCLFHPAAANQTFLVSDGEDLTVTELLLRTAAAANQTARLVPIPVFLLRVAGCMFGKTAMIRRICDNLQVDITTTRRLLGWEPPVSVAAALHKAVRQFQRE